MSNLLKIIHNSGNWQKHTFRAIAVGIYKDLKLSRQLQGVNKALGRGLSNALSGNIIEGNVGEVKIVVGKKGSIAIIYGLGEKSKVDSEILRKAGGAISKTCIKNKIESFSFLLPIDIKDKYMHQAAVEGLVLGSYQFNELKTTDKNDFKIKKDFS